MSEPASAAAAFFANITNKRKQPSQSASPPPLTKETPNQRAKKQRRSKLAEWTTKSPYWELIPKAVPKVAPEAAPEDNNLHTKLYDFFARHVKPVPDKVKMVGNEYAEKRLTGVFKRQAGTFEYSGSVKQADGQWPAEVQQLAEIAFKCLRREEDEAEDEAEAYVDASMWKTCFFNWYRDGSDSLGLHADSDGIDAPIASFSLGESRDFHVRCTATKTTMSRTLKSGDLLIMYPGMQQRYKHGVPARTTAMQGRINVTFRCT